MSYLFLGIPGGLAMENLFAVQKTWVQSLGQEDPLEKEKAIHSSILTWEIPRTEEPGRLQSLGLQQSDTTEQLTQFNFASHQARKEGVPLAMEELRVL